jgi:hypothetical protein
VLLAQYIRLSIAAGEQDERVAVLVDDIESGSGSNQHLLRSAAEKSEKPKRQNRDDTAIFFGPFWQIGYMGGLPCGKEGGCQSLHARETGASTHLAVEMVDIGPPERE